MSSAPHLSSEQALDDYFTALLSEEWGDEDFSAPKKNEAAPELARKAAPVEEPYSSSMLFVDDEDIEELPGANLEEVQRLLNQLEQSNPVAELHLDEMMEQNTVEIAQEPVQTEPVIDEIQEWDVETLTEDDEGEPHHHTVEVIVEPQEEIAETVIEETWVAQTEVETETELESQWQETVVETSAVEPEIVVEEQVKPQTQTGGLDLENWQNPVRHNAFQVLYFDVNGVTFAVPLDELGGIHRKTSLNHLIGRPAWYLGLQTQRDAQLDVVDTAKWVMAEKLHDESYKEAYQYIVMLGESMWGLACSQLMGTELLKSEQVRWREQVGKRPWLAGMVKEKMCALIHVDALIAMLNAGLDVKALDK
ncbi:chemotaxis protein CheW [Vibrio porteresiae]|uniref:Chemotaxis protein CheW n=1 Tax=Vibrio porteresiae DSM 19223 TaxID=1123496 RepID=A0ABZ0QFF3_9VIBR|nr:chemotaxis protein CheW [Vibrio porteresiae]WPC74912.1 chemotaxis protein CheW [Vibrio porteresiae DSM 19223]